MKPENTVLPSEKLAELMFALIRRLAPCHAFHAGLVSRLEELIQTAQGLLLDDLALQQSVDSTKKPHNTARQRLLELRYSPDKLAANEADAKSLANWVLKIASQELQTLKGTMEDVLDLVAAADVISSGLSVDHEALVDLGLRPDEALEQKETRELYQNALAEVTRFGTETEKATVAVREANDDVEVEMFASLLNVSNPAINYEMEKQSSMKPAALRKRVSRARQSWLLRLAAPLAACVALICFGATQGQCSDQTGKIRFPSFRQEVRSDQTAPASHYLACSTVRSDQT